MKRLLPAVALTLMLVACGGVTARWNVEFVRATEEQKKELAGAIERMIEGRTLAVEKKLTSKKFTPSGNGGTLSVTVEDEDAANALKNQLELPFTFELMTQTPVGQKGDVETEKYGSFSKSGLDAAKVEWVDARVPPTGGTTTVAVIFTEEGRTLFKKILSENEGKLIGIFVRGRLMSLQQVQAKDQSDSVVIDNVPSAQIAASFADDVNVSLHAKFTAE
jgi:hypothetical protein